MEMEDKRSLLARFTSVAGRIGSILNATDMYLLDRQQLKLTGTIKHLLQDARLDIRDWEMADTREEMQRHGRDALERLEQARASILLASEHNLFSAIDVAEITAQFEHFAAELKS
jgi:hypothetical protein